jgi:hypothetical protein
MVETIFTVLSKSRPSQRPLFLDVSRQNVICVLPVTVLAVWVTLLCHKRAANSSLGIWTKHWFISRRYHIDLAPWSWANRVGLEFHETWMCCEASLVYNITEFVLQRLDCWKVIYKKLCSLGDILRGDSLRLYWVTAHCLRLIKQFISYRILYLCTSVTRYDTMSRIKLMMLCQYQFDELLSWGYRLGPWAVFFNIYID